MDIATGAAESHPTPLPYDPGMSPATARETVTAGLLTPADQGGVRDLTGERLGQLASYEQDCAAAQSAGMAAENRRRDHYAQDVLPQGAAYGDAMALPVVPDNAVPASQSFGYPFPGLEPTEAEAGMAGPYPA